MSELTEGDLLARYQSLDANYSPKSIKRPDILPTGLPGLDNLLGGGVPLGYVISIEGHLLTQSGKSGLAYLLCGALQKEGAALWLDTNQVFSLEHAKNCQVDTDNLALVNIREASQALRTLEKGIKGRGISCVVLDSIAGLIPKETQIGGPQVVKIFTERLEDLEAQCQRHQCSLILINEFKDRVDQLVGGPATKCIPQIRLRVEGTYGIKQYGIRRGIKSRVTNIKNHLSKPNKQWELYINYESGPDKPLDVVLAAVEKGIILQRGSWYHYNEESYQGVRELRDALEDRVSYLYKELIAS